MKKLILLIILVALLGTLSGFSVEEASALGGTVKFRGVVSTDEEWGSFVCYGSYHCFVTVEEILYDPNGTLTLGANVSVCYFPPSPLYLKVGERVECFGHYWVGSAAPLQCGGYVACTTIGCGQVGFYVKRFHPVGGIYIPVNKLELLAPYIGLTILLAIAVISVGYVKKRKRLALRQTIKEPVKCM